MPNTTLARGLPVLNCNQGGVTTFRFNQPAMPLLAMTTAPFPATRLEPLKVGTTDDTVMALPSGFDRTRLPKGCGRPEQAPKPYCVGEVQSVASSTGQVALP